MLNKGDEVNLEKERIIQIIREECMELGWNFDEVLPFLQTLGFTPEKVEGNSMFGEHKVRTTVHLGYLAFQESKVNS